MPEFDNPSFLRLGAGAALAFGSLLPEVLQLQFGALELALEAPELFLGAPEMVPAIELVRGPELQREKNLVKTPEIAQGIAHAIAQGIAQLNRWVLSFPPLAFSAMAALPTWLNTVLPAALVARTAPKVDLASSAKALEQVLKLIPFAAPFFGSTEMKILLLSFVPFRAIDLWPALLNGEDDRRHGWRGLVKKMKGLRE